MTHWQKVRRLPVVGRAADWGMGGHAVSKRTEQGRRPHRGPEGHRERVPVLRRRLRPGRLHARRRARRHRGQPALADQPGHAVPQGLGVAASSSSSPAACTKVRYRRPGGTEWEDLDLETAMDMIADRVDRGPRERLAGRQPRGPARRPHARLRPPRRRHARQRGELPPQEGLHGHGRGPDREPGPHMTLLHGPRSGGLVRARRRHLVPAGHPARRLRLDPGLLDGRGAPGRLPLGDEGP